MSSMSSVIGWQLMMTHLHTVEEGNKSGKETRALAMLSSKIFAY